jgi:hypothetical protein
MHLWPANHDPDREAERERQLPLAGLGRVHRHHLARKPARLDGCEGERRHRSRRLDPCRLQRFPGLGADQLRGLQAGCDLDEDLGALVRRQRLAHRRLRSVDGAACLVGACVRDASDDIARVRRPHAQPFVRSTHSPPTNRRRSVAVAATELV